MKFAQHAHLGIVASGVCLASQGYTASTSPPVYILGPIQPASIALGEALRTLGYSHVHAADANGQATLGSNTFTELSPCSAANVDLAMQNPGARFILPSKAVACHQQLLGACVTKSPFDLPESHTQAVQHFFAQKRHAHQLLVLNVSATAPSAQAENWVVLCEFLGLGYSIVERLKLWHFPH